MANYQITAPAVSIVIPVLNGEKYIKECFNAIARLNTPRERFEVILVDNGSTDCTVANASQFMDKFSLKIYSRPGSGICAVRNFGAQSSSSKVIAFLDADCIVSHDWLNSGLAAFGCGAALTGCAYHIPARSTWVGRAWDITSGKKSFAGQADWLPAGNMFVRRDVFLKAGGFNETITSDEDCELCYRIKKLGYTLFSDPAIKVVHMGTPQTVSAFFKKELWHGRDVFRLFLASGRSLNVVLFALFYVCAFAGAISAIVIAATQRFYFPLAVIVLAMLSLPAALALKSALQSSRYRYAVNLGFLYLVYGVARALCIIDVLSWAPALTRQGKRSTITSGAVVSEDERGVYGKSQKKRTETVCQPRYS